MTFFLSFQSQITEENLNKVSKAFKNKYRIAITHETFPNGKIVFSISDFLAKAPKYYWELDKLIKIYE